MKVHILKEKFSDSFHTIEQDQSVGQAVKLMSGYSVSALVVVTKEKTSGIFTERDLVRSHTLFPDKKIDQIPIRDVMTTKLVVINPEDKINDAMKMMIKAKIRHLPVVSSDGEANETVQGMLCLEDLVKSHVGALTEELHYLQGYISDLQDAAHD